jgi:hypothetical protein
LPSILPTSLILSGDLELFVSKTNGLLKYLSIYGLGFMPNNDVTLTEKLDCELSLNPLNIKTINNNIFFI